MNLENVWIILIGLFRFGALYVIMKKKMEIEHLFSSVTKMKPIQAANFRNGFVIVNQKFCKKIPQGLVPVNEFDQLH